jgi:hypothetical protein
MKFGEVCDANRARYVAGETGGYAVMHIGKGMNAMLAERAELSRGAREGELHHEEGTGPKGEERV